MAAAPPERREIPGYNDEHFQGYFKGLADDYKRQTGNTTADLFLQALDIIQPSIDETSVVHDNAAGPGTAAFVLLERYKSPHPGHIEITDQVEPMVNAATAQIPESLRDRIKATKMDSAKLQFPDHTFTHSITNFSVFATLDLGSLLKEVFRTLKPGGQAIFTTWRRFQIIDLLEEARQEIAPGREAVLMPRPDLQTEGVLAGYLVDAGFDKTKIKTFETGMRAQGDTLEAIRGFMCGKATLTHYAKDWSEAELAGRPAVVSKMVDKAKANGGIVLDAWVVTATK